MVGEAASQKPKREALEETTLAGILILSFQNG
jgi:hypothetical protein